MSFRDHKPVDATFGDGQDCIWCGEPWPCRTRKVVVEVAEHIKPKNGINLPMPLDEYDLRNKIAEELFHG